MKRRRRRKCLQCRALFHPDPRNVRHQHYCSKIQCRKASKTASQHRWLSKAVNKNYFRGPENVQRVQTWRQAHPGYWQTLRSETKDALQEDIAETGRRLVGLGGEILNTQSVKPALHFGINVEEKRCHYNLEGLSALFIRS